MDVKDKPDMTRAEGFADMNSRITGCLSKPGGSRYATAGTVAYLYGMLARLDQTRERIVETITQHEEAIERRAEADRA